MGKLIDIAGQRFGKLMVIERAGVTRLGEATWRCKCDCGRETTVQGRNLRNGSTKSCDWNRSRRIDIVGQRFGRLVVIEYVDNDKWGDPRWRCKCDCGHEKVLTGGSLRSGNTKSCGCLLKEKESGPNSAHWKGGRRKDPDGYVQLHRPKHPFATKSGNITEHRLVWMKANGPIPKEATIHHINGIKSDNRLCNLELWDRQHPAGQRVKDKIDYAIEILEKYRPDLLTVHARQKVS